MRYCFSLHFCHYSNVSIFAADLASTSTLEYAPFIDFMKNMESPLLGIAFGALFTALVQSSSASIVIHAKPHITELAT